MQREEVLKEMKRRGKRITEQRKILLTDRGVLKNSDQDFSAKIVVNN